MRRAPQRLSGIVSLTVGRPDPAVLQDFLSRRFSLSRRAAKAIIDGVETTSVEVDETPQSASEVVDFLGSDFYADSLHLSDWNYIVKIDPDGDPNHTEYTISTAFGKSYLVPVSIIVSETRPINIVLGKE